MYTHVTNGHNIQLSDTSDSTSLIMKKRTHSNSGCE